MKKIIAFCITFSILFATMVLPGCGGGGKKDPVKSLKIYQLSGSGGVVALGKELYTAGTVLAEGLIEIGSNYVLYVNGSLPTIESYVQEDGVRLSDSVDIVKDFSEAGYKDCFNFNNMGPALAGGTSVEIIPTHPGKCKMISTSGTLTRPVEVLVFDGIAVIPGAGNGYRVDDDGHYLSGTKMECAFWTNNIVGFPVILPGKAYKFDTGDPYNWRGKLKNMTTVDVDAVNAGAVDQVLNVGDMYVAQNPLGGYVKICWIQGEGIIWEYTSTTSFR
jgi:hypothetical protein